MSDKLSEEHKMGYIVAGRPCGLFLVLLLFPWSQALSLDSFIPDKIIPYKTIGDVTLNLLPIKKD